MGNRNANDEMPVRYSVINWPKGLRIARMYVFPNVAAAVINGVMLEPPIPLSQLARFLNDHVQGAVEKLIIEGGEGLEDGLPRLLNKVNATGRLHVDCAYFFDFFHLPPAGIERILNGRTLRANMIGFIRLQLPNGVDANEFLKLPTIRECSRLSINICPPQLPGPPPLFDKAALMEWLKQGDDRLLVLASHCLSDGHVSFLNALKEDFQQATQVHSYSVGIDCPSINGVAGGLGVRDEVLYNRLGEKMVIDVGASPTATERWGHPIESLQVTRVLPD